MPGLRPGPFGVATFVTDEEKKWDRLMSHPKARDAESLAQLLSENKGWFEEQTEEGCVPKRGMVITGIAQFCHWQGGFAGTQVQAWRVFDAFMMSDCSWEVKLLILEVAETLKLGRVYRERPDYLR